MDYVVNQKESDRPMSGKPVKRACDLCHARKVKCNGSSPCETCERAELECTFLNPVLPKGPAPRSTRRSGSTTTHRSKKARTDSNTATAPELDWALQKEVAEWAQQAASGFLEPIEPTWEVPEPTSDNGWFDSGAAALPIQQDEPQDRPTPQGLHVSHYRPQGVNALPDVTIDTASFNRPFNNFSMFGTSMNPPSMEWNVPFRPPEDISPIFTLTIDSLIKPQLNIFFERVYPMLPIFDQETIFAGLRSTERLQDRAFVALVLSMVSLSLIHPLMPEEINFKAARVKQSKMLMDEACRLRAKWDYGCQATVEGATTSYLMFGTLFELGFAEGSRFRLQEAISTGDQLRLDCASTYLGLDKDEAQRRMRLFWVLAVTERAYALQRNGRLTFEGGISLQHLTTAENFIGDSASQTLRHLACIFSFIDQDIVSCWNTRCDPLNCTVLTSKRVISILGKLKGSAASLFGKDLDLAGLSEVQKADLLITWQWLRNRIWRLAACHGLTREGAEYELSAEYVVDVATTTVAICKRLSLRAMEAHGTGFVEKLYDIASIVSEMLQRQPGVNAKLLMVAQTDQWGQLLQDLYYYVTRHGAGMAFAAPMAEAVDVVAGVRLLKSC